MAGCAVFFCPPEGNIWPVAQTWTMRANHVRPFYHQLQCAPANDDHTISIKALAVTATAVSQGISDKMRVGGVRCGIGERPLGHATIGRSDVTNLVLHFVSSDIVQETHKPPHNFIRWIAHG